MLSQLKIEGGKTMKLTDENAKEYWAFQNYVLSYGFDYTKKRDKYTNHRSKLAYAFLEEKNLMNDFNKWREEVDCDIYVLPELISSDDIEHRKKYRNQSNAPIQIAIYLIVHDLCHEFKLWISYKRLYDEVDENTYPPKLLAYTESRFKRFKRLLWHLSEDDEYFFPCKKPR